MRVLVRVRVLVRTQVRVRVRVSEGVRVRVIRVRLGLGFGFYLNDVVLSVAAATLSGIAGGVVEAVGVRGAGRPQHVVEPIANTNKVRVVYIGLG